MRIVLLKCNETLYVGDGVMNDEVQAARGGDAKLACRNEKASGGWFSDSGGACGCYASKRGAYANGAEFGMVSGVFVEDGEVCCAKVLEGVVRDIAREDEVDELVEAIKIISEFGVIWLIWGGI
jgi:hypothetical protein